LFRNKNDNVNKSTVFFSYRGSKQNEIKIEIEIDSEKARFYQKLGRLSLIESS